MKWEVEYSPAYSLLKVQLEPGEELTSEAGAMVLFRGNLEIKTHTGGGLLKGLLRGIAGTEAVFLNTYRAKSPAEVLLAPSLPGDIAYIPLEDGSYVVQDSAYLAHIGDVDVEVAWRGLKGVLAEGELVWLRLKGRGGAWVNSYGAMGKMELKAGERVTLDNMHFVALNEETKWRIRKFGGWKTFLLGGEGLVVEVEGPGTLFYQTRILPPFARLLKKFIPSRK
ncbi:TIGR00266 family protein [Candidatus Bathyarchaeota archaeon]|nr:MAG: TIGR00266 family protein [Candidatus Bathyarchaeota archaeon]